MTKFGDRSDRLYLYRTKRAFKKTPEPKGKPRARKTSRALVFSVQKHLATALHYDLRLEHNGVLLSWAVPKGPSLNPADRRLAMRTEDHPIEYADFEGPIPEGYGAGVMLLWDRGTWRPEERTADVDAALARGELKFALDGVKLKGSWVLVRTKGGVGGEEREQWMLIKHRDFWSGDVDVAAVAPRSVKSDGDFADVLAESKRPDALTQWTRKPPRKGGEAGELLRQVIDQARQKRAESNAPKKMVNYIAPKLPASALRFGSKRPALSNQAKPLYSSGFTKGQVIDYYTRIAPFILPHLRGRPVTLRRWPNGTTGQSFFEKNCPAHRPSWVRTVRISSDEDPHKAINYCLIEDVSSLVWAANLASLELHVPMARAESPTRPTAVVFDLDPGPPARLRECAIAALRLRDALLGIGLKTLVKTSGSKGLHAYVPLNTPEADSRTAKEFARAVAVTMQRHDPKLLTATMAKSERPGKVFIDWSQNDRHKTTVCPYSLRALAEPTVSTPICWDEVDDITKFGTSAFSPDDVLIRVERNGDIFADVLAIRQSIPPVL